MITNIRLSIVPAYARNLVAIAVVLLRLNATAVAVDTAAAKRELAANRTKWESHDIRSYQFRLRDENCFCMYAPYYGPIRVIVKDNRIQKAMYVGERRDGYWPGRTVREKTELAATVEGVFKRAEGVINATSKAPYTIRYDPVYGFPTVIDVGNPPKMADAQWKLVVDQFHPSSK